MAKVKANPRTPPTPELQGIFHISDDPGPTQFFFLPIYFRSRGRYYRDALARSWKRVEGTYRGYEFKYPTLDDYAASKDAEYWWRSPYTPWWGVGDIVGFLDARLHEDGSAIRLVCFKTIKKPSSILVERTMSPGFHLDEPLPNPLTDTAMAQTLLAILDKAKARPELKGRWVEDRHLRALISCVEWVRYMRAAASQE